MKKAFSLAVLVALSGSVFAADPQPAPVPNLAKPGETITPAAAPAPAAAPVAAPASAQQCSAAAAAPACVEAKAGEAPKPKPVVQRRAPRPAVEKEFAPAPARMAVAKSASWADDPRAQPVMGEEGKVVYVFGESRPTIVCAPLRVCDVELEAGETVNNADVGDAVRWSLKPSISGAGADRTVHVIIKPKDYDLDTNAIIATDRRTYYLRLVSPREGINAYTTRVAFYYPENERKAWEAQRAAMVKEEKTVVSDLPPLTADKLNFGYALDGKDHFKPVRVFDDGAKVYIQMPMEFQHREAPALVLVGKDGKEQLVNYRLKNDYYIVDKLFSKAALILGVGDDQRRVTITRDECKKRGFFGSCVE